MADEAKSNTKPKSKSSKMKKKRKLEQTTSEGTLCGSETYTHEVCKKAKTVTENEDSIPKPASSRPLRNLQLILTLQNKEIELQKKIEMTSDFVKSAHREEDYNTNQVSETVKVPRLLVFLNDWIQSLLISSGNRGNIHGNRSDRDVENPYLDIRCWEIFKFCLEKSANLKVALNFSRNILRPIQFVAMHALCQLNDVSLNTKQPYTSADFEICGVVADCFYLLYSAHDGTSKENLELWISTVNAVVELINKIFLLNLNDEKAGFLIIRFSCLLLEPFAKFLRIHPTRKGGFGDFTRKLFEPLMQLLGFLYPRIEGSNSCHVSNLLKLVGEVLSQGVFHLIHMDGFLTLHGVDKYHPAHDGKSEDSKTFIKSYHRHLFEQLEKILVGRNMMAIDGVGDLIHLLVDQVKKHKGAALLPDGASVSINRDSKGEGDNLGYKSISLASHDGAFQKNGYCINLNAEARKSLFEFFVQIIEPVLVKLIGYFQEDVEVGQMVDIHCSLKFINKVFSGLMQEQIYIRTEDISEGACLGFLRKVYDTISKFSFKLNFFWLSRHPVDVGLDLEISSAVSKELIVALGCLLEIEYEVMGNDLVGLWHLLLSHLAVGISMRDLTDTVSLINKTLDTACQLINLFGELRQVKGAFFALCEAIRLFGTCESDGTSSSQLFSGSSTLSYETFVKSVVVLLSSPEFKMTAHNAVCSIPEGQVSGFIQHLAEDLGESLKWLRLCCSKSTNDVLGELNVGRCSVQDMNLHIELLGKGLSEMYTIVLDSLIVNTSNSVIVGSSIKNLMTVLHPSLSTLVELSTGSVSRFLYSISGGTFDDDISDNTESSTQHGVPSPWAFIFFFRLYMSCRSLYRRIISLVPPISSRKMSASMGDLFTAYSGKDWTERTDCIDEGYFSWIVKPSAPLLSVIQSISDIYFQNDAMDSCCLVYVFHSMALQRLADLNRQIKSAEYVLQAKNNMVQSELLDDAGQLKQRKKCKKWEKGISSLREEATGLTDYMTSHLLLIADDPLFSGYDVFNGHCHYLCEGSEWDLGVYSLSKRSFPIAIWWTLCQNIEIWCIHAGKKILKMFLCLLIRTSLPSMKRNPSDLAVSTNSKQQMKVNVHQLSTELLCDSTLYEFKFVRRHLASRFCHVLKSAVTSCNTLSSSDTELSSPPDWSAFLAALEESFAVSLIKQGKMKVVNHDLYSSNDLDTKFRNGQEAFYQDGMKYASCKNLLDLMCWMPKEHLTSKSSMLYATNVLNLERLAVSSLVDCPGGSLRDDASELIKLLLSCRRALKHLVVSSFDENSGVGKSSKSSILSNASFPMLWIMKSVYMVAGIQDVLRQDQSDCLKDVIFSLMDHTSFIYLTYSKHYFFQIIHRVGYVEKLCKDQCNSIVDHHESSLVGSDSHLDSSRGVEASESVYNVAQGIKEELKNLLSSLGDGFHDRRLDSGGGYADLSKLASLVACFSGYFWGLVSALSQVDGKDSGHKVILSRWKRRHIAKLDQYVNVFTNVAELSIQILLMDNKQQQTYLGDEQTKKLLDSVRDLLGIKQLPLGNGFLDKDMSSGGEQQKGIVAAYLESSQSASDCFTASSLQQKLLTQSATNVARVSTEANSLGLLHLNRPLLRRLLKGDLSEAAFLLRHILIGSSAILRLNLLVGAAGLSLNVISMFMEISHFLIREFAKADDVWQSFSFVWLDGVVKYLEELGSHFSLTNPALSRDTYAKLIELHIMAIGKCITLGGKKYKLTSHGTESTTKIFDNFMRLKKSADLRWLFSLEEFKVRLRTSFKVFVKKASELHLLSAVQAVERALVGAEEGFTAFYGINTGGTDGGMVSPYAAAGVECLDLLLENVSGRKRLNVVRRHVHSFLACLFNMILHVQSPLIFCDRSLDKLFDSPDLGAVVLMCIEVLIRISGKHALFQLEFWHVVHSLHIPASLFQHFGQLRLFKHPAVSGDGSSSDNLHYDTAVRIDWQFSVDLYTACCRLLHTVLKHHKSETERCIAMLQESVSVLLHHLEMVDADLSVKEASLSLKVQDGVKCAGSLRRIYEEMKQQKDTFGPHCFKFLSSYIVAYSGYGPLKSGIRREIDEALRPGVYALIDACSSEDLQHLHTVFGEGPCRNTLANLQHDYKLNFQYEGKV